MPPAAGALLSELLDCSLQCALANSNYGVIQAEMLEPDTDSQEEEAEEASAFPKIRETP